MNTFGKMKKQTVQAMQGRANAAEWNTVREWTGPRAEATKTLRKLVRELGAR